MKPAALRSTRSISCVSVVSACRGACIRSIARQRPRCARAARWARRRAGSTPPRPTITTGGGGRREQVRWLAARIAGTKRSNRLPEVGLVSLSYSRRSAPARVRRSAAPRAATRVLVGVPRCSATAVHDLAAPRLPYSAGGNVRMAMAYSPSAPASFRPRGGAGPPPAARPSRRSQSFPGQTITGRPPRAPSAATEARAAAARRISSRRVGEDHLGRDLPEHRGRS